MAVTTTDVSSRFAHRKLHESHGSASEGVSLERSGSFAHDFFEFLAERCLRAFHFSQLRVEASETPWMEHPPPLIPRLLQSATEFHLLVARVSRGTLFLDASWNEGAGLPLMQLSNELLSRRLLSRWHRRACREPGYPRECGLTKEMPQTCRCCVGRYDMQ